MLDECSTVDKQLGARIYTQLHKG